MFTIHNLQYKDIVSIEQLEIKEGKITCLFGESGSGKSTILKMLNNMLTPDHGEIMYYNKNLLDYSPIELRKEVVMLGQEPIMFEGDIRSNLTIGLTFSGKDIVEDMVLEELLKKLQLHKGLDEDANQLSGGEKQRIAFGRVILMNANVYLLDEPTSALDEDTEQLVMQYFTNYLKEEKKTAVLVTHSKDVAKKYADRIVYMHELNDKKVTS
ncbi:ATP-binding cassette domain-containing protein [Gracilibacillus marinus]|jgi:putative ABC transport system ATP-binding protein|uniref:ATP-binding cassette domain-containing protein n=1 Tax=Gracilibacillus marinus TaxID=630535 RepID=A0ABV8VVY7_9BACI